MIKTNKSIKVQKRVRLHKKIRTQVKGTAAKPRLAVFRSNMYTYAQIINDDTATTLCAANDMKLGKMTKTEHAITVGKTIGELAKKAGITTVVFDRAGFRYGGRIKALADAARETGLAF
jgi:large subunit ribosomal protein L18